MTRSFDCASHKEPHRISANYTSVRIRKRTTRRAVVLLAGVLLILAIVLGVGQRAARKAGTPFVVEKLAREILAPSVRAGGSLRNRLADDPAATVTTPVALTQLRELQEQNRQLSALLGLRDNLARVAIAAEVIDRGNTPLQAYLTLDKGTADGIEPHMVVLTPEGALGQVSSVTTRTAQVLLLTDRAGGIGAMTERTRATGVLKGDRKGKCRLIYLDGRADVRPGDQVITSGLGHIYPAGFPLGTVERVTTDVVLSTKTAIVQPAADLAKVEYVLVVK